MSQRALADNRDARVHADPDAKRLLDFRRSAFTQLLDAPQQLQASAHSTSGLVLRRQRISKLCADAVAYVVDDSASRLIDASGADCLKLQQNFPQILWIAALGETC